MRHCPLETLFTLEHLEPGLAERVPERAERVRVQRGGRERTPAGSEVTRGRCCPKLFAEPSELLEKLVAREEPPREEPRGTLCRVPRAEVLDDGLWMYPRLGILCELAHGRRPPRPLGGRAKLLEDLLVGVATAHARAKGGKLCLVDAHGRTLV